MAGKKALRSSVFTFYQLHKDKGKAYTVNHFKGQDGYTRGYLYALIKTFEERGTDKMNLSANGRKKKLSKNDAKILKKAVNDKTGCSQRKLTRKFGVAQSTISHELKRLEIRYYKRKRAPKATAEQKQRQKERLQKLSRGVFRPTGPAHIIMDDESYFTLDGAAMPGNSGYYTIDRDSCPSDVKFRTESKFPEKVMVWQIISERGRGQLYVPPKKSSMNTERYVKNCLPRVKKFKKKFYKKKEHKDVWFWPDLATCHYSNDSQTQMTAQDIQYITRDINPPNAPMIRPIEAYWAILKQKVYENN